MLYHLPQTHQFTPFKSTGQARRVCLALGETSLVRLVASPRYTRTAIILLDRDRLYWILHLSSIHAYQACAWLNFPCVSTAGLRIAAFDNTPIQGRVVSPIHQPSMVVETSPDVVRFGILKWTNELFPGDRRLASIPREILKYATLPRSPALLRRR